MYAIRSYYGRPSPRHRISRRVQQFRVACKGRRPSRKLHRRITSYNVCYTKLLRVIKKTVATGSVVPRQEIEIKPQISGIVDELFVEAGDYIKKDQVIARIKIIPDMVTLNSVV